MRTFLTTLLFAGVLGGGVCLGAKTEPPAPSNKNTTTIEHKAVQAEKQPATPTAEGYLGVAIEPLHSTLVERVERLFGKGQGVLVARVAEGSPAAKAGLQANDVVVAYDNQKIYSPIQLGRLVRNDKPGREASLGIVRAGESKEVKVQIGDFADSSAMRERNSLSGERPRRLRTATEEVDGTWSSFDSLVLERQGDNHFRAEIKYRDTNSKIASREFKGSIADIRKDVNAQRDMPTIERQHLLRALDASERPTEFAMPRNRVARTLGPESQGVIDREEVNWTFVF